MKLVIEIDEETYKYWKKHKCEMVIKAMSPYINISKAIANATPLTDCADAISRSAVIEAFVDMRDGYPNPSGEMISDKTILSVVYSLPSVNPTRKKRMDEQTIKDIDRAFKALEERDELLDKIRAEIKELNQHKAKFVTSDGKSCIATDDVLAIIDKYSKGGDSNA